MKKERIYNIVIASIILLMLFVPIRVIDFSEFELGYVFIIGSFLVGCKYLQFFDWLSLFLILFTFLTIALIITFIVKPKLTVKIASSVSALICVIMWIIVLSNSNLTMSNYHHGEYITLLIFYIALLITIVVLTALQYLQYLPPRKPSKTERLQAQIDELQKQVDELNSKDDN